MPSLVCLGLSNAVLATLLAALAAVVACFCRRPVVRHALWLLVLLKLITPPLMPFSVTWPRSAEIEPPSSESPPPAIPLPPMPERQKAIFSLPESSEPPEAPETDLPSALPPSVPFWKPLLLVLWLGGALVWWSVAAVRLRKFQRLLRHARPAPADAQEQGRRLAARLGLRRCPPIVFVSAPLSPMLWALGFSPRLLVPAELWQKLTAEQQDTLLVHELAHLRRGDHWIRRLEFVVLGLYWWHPVVWWARRRLQEAEEECCDALVVAVLPEAASAYASALVETVAFLWQSRAAALVGASGAGQVPLLKRRLTMILMTTSSRRPSRLAFWTVLGLGALLLPLAPQAARTEAPEEPAHKESPRHENAKRQSAAPERNRGDEIDNLQDEIELLKLEVQLKETQLDSAKTLSAEFRQRVDNQRAVNQRNPGTIPIPFDTLMESEIKAKTLEAEANVKAVELKQAVVRLKQAERRLARLQRPAEKTDGSGRAKQEKRLRELEQKVENLLKEIQKLRKEMQPEKPRAPGPIPDGVKR